ncbi:MAG: hypothetical protein ACRDNP_06130 [Gaiellaceae bacterium]
MRTRKRLVCVLVAACLGVLVAVATAAVAGGAEVSRSATDTSAAREPVDLFYVSDSSGWGVAELYGRHIKKALGVAVRVHDSTEPNLSASMILKQLRGGYGPTPIRLVRGAEVIVVYGSPMGLEVVEEGTCFDGKPPLEVGPQLWVKYVPALKAIYKRIFQIRKGKPVILRTANWYVPELKRWEKAGMLEICTKLHESLAAAIAEAAAAYRVPVADVYTAFNGKTHLDPVAKGYILPDGIHVTSKGRAVIAKTFADLGYKQVNPPR